MLARHFAAWSVKALSANPTPQSSATPEAFTATHGRASGHVIIDANLQPTDSRQLALLCGPLDEHLRQIEKRLGVQIRNRGAAFRILGEPAVANATGNLLRQLLDEIKRGVTVNSQSIHVSLQESCVQALSKPVQVSSAHAGEDATGAATDSHPSLIQTHKKSVKVLGGNQMAYVQAIRGNDVNFGIGPAGTGKTYLAVACAVEALKQQRIKRLLLVRPAVEAGEKLGFLPGDLSQKVDPYLRPLYDALYEMVGFERVEKLLERNVIEVAPLAFMRGRTLNESFIILDESQNTTIEQMKMFLTRIGFGSTVVVTGDITQVDLPRGTVSGLRNVLSILDNVPGISFTRFSPKDVVRHPLVQRIVEAYERHESGDG